MKNSLSREEVSSDLHKKINHIIALVQQSLEHFESKTSDKSLEKLQETMGEMEHLIKDLQNDYEPSLKNTQLSTWEEDRHQINVLQSQGTPSPEQIWPVLNNIHQHIYVLKQEVHRRYPTSPWYKKLSSQQKRWGAIIIGTVVTVSLLGSIVRNHFKGKHGLSGTYFSDTRLGRKAKTRLDSSINFQWGKGSPFKRWKKDNFSIRWTGFVFIPKKGSYEFITHSDDGIRLKLSEQAILEDWTTHGIKMNRAQVQLEKGYYPLTVEYFDGKSKAAVRLSWKIPGSKKAEIIKAKFLVPNEKKLKSSYPIQVYSAPQS